VYGVGSFIRFSNAQATGFFVCPVSKEISDNMRESNLSKVSISLILLFVFFTQGFKKLLNRETLKTN
jgi:hypothetical protein